MAERAAQLEEVGASAQMERGEGVAERVEAGLGRSGLLDERLEDALAQVAGVDQAAGVVDEDQGRRVLIRLRRQVLLQLLLPAKRRGARPCFRALTSAGRSGP